VIIFLFFLLSIITTTELHQLFLLLDFTEGRVLMIEVGNPITFSSYPHSIPSYSIPPSFSGLRDGEENEVCRLLLFSVPSTLAHP
jgi:hypothetical protein